MEYDRMLGMNDGGVGSRGVERAVGERNGATANSGVPVGVPDPELVQSAKRRRFTAEYKLQVLREADGCSGSGEIGELLRREGLYRSHLATWRRQRDEGALGALSRPRGRKPSNPLEAENAKLRKRAERAEAELSKARRVIEVQGNVSALLGELLEPRGATDTGSTER
jgi:transposase